MSHLSRREFLAGMSAAAGTVALAPRFTLAKGTPAVEPVKVSSGAEIVTLGRSGIKTSVLGIGTGTRSGREQRGLGEEGFVQLVHQAYERGIRYLDTADMYKTHQLIGRAIKDLPREEMFIQTKTLAKRADKAKADIERFRKEIGIETLDTLLMHCMTRKNWPTDLRPVLDVLVDAKKKGRIRAIGVSCHDYEALKDAVDCDEIDVHLVRINPFGSHMEGTPEQISAQIERMHAKGRGVIGMKIYGEGAFKSAEKRLQSLKYVLGLGTVHCFTIGFSSIAQIDETLDAIKKATA